jgi:hypothetical protein
MIKRIINVGSFGRTLYFFEDGAHWKLLMNEEVPQPVEGNH